MFGCMGVIYLAVDLSSSSGSGCCSPPYICKKPIPHPVPCPPPFMYLAVVLLRIWLLRARYMSSAYSIRHMATGARAMPATCMHAQYKGGGDEGSVQKADQQAGCCENCGAQRPPMHAP